MVSGADIYIDTKNNALFIGIGDKMTDESIIKFKEGLSDNKYPYDAIYILEKINSVQYVSGQDVVEINSDGTFKYMD